MKHINLAGFLKQRFSSGQLPSSPTQRASLFSRMSPRLDPPPPTRLQEAFDYAKSCVRNDGAFSADSVAKLRKLIGAVPLEELGFSSDLLQVANPLSATSRVALPKWAEQTEYKSSRITYLHIHEDDDLTMGIFCFPANATIPLHNHPDMTVVSRLLFGTMQVKSYDWVEESPEGSSRGGGVAQLIADETITAPAEPFVLFPEEGNIHSFTANTPCAVLDLLTPPYAPEFGRDCTYYEEHSLSDEDLQKLKESSAYDKAAGALYSYLQEYEPPSDFEVTRGRYAGKPVRTSH